jgi:hypothetical protein
MRENDLPFEGSDQEPDMDSPASYFNWGFVSISLPNLALMGLMLLIFASAVVLPFPFTHTPAEDSDTEPS